MKSHRERETNKQKMNETKSGTDPDTQLNKQQFKVLLTPSRKREEKEEMTWAEIASFCSLSLRIIRDLPNMHLGESLCPLESLSGVWYCMWTWTHTCTDTHTHTHSFFVFSFCLNISVLDNTGCSSVVLKYCTFRSTVNTVLPRLLSALLCQIFRPSFWPGSVFHEDSF